MRIHKGLGLILLSACHALAGGACGDDDEDDNNGGTGGIGGSGATGGTGFSCTGFVKSADLYAGKLSAFNTSVSPISDTSWPVGTTKSFMIAGSLPSAAPQSAEGKDATLTLTWDASS